MNEPVVKLTRAFEDPFSAEAGALLIVYEELNKKLQPEIRRNLELVGDSVKQFFYLNGCELSEVAVRRIDSLVGEAGIEASSIERLAILYVNFPLPIEVVPRS